MVHLFLRHNREYAEKSRIMCSELTQRNSPNISSMQALTSTKVTEAVYCSAFQPNYFSAVDGFRITLIAVLLTAK